MLEQEVERFLRLPAKGRALVADDTKLNRTVLCHALKGMGYEVVEAEDGQQAIDMFRSLRIDMVLMDVLMPVKDGYQATSEIKALCKGRFVPVLFVTAIHDIQALIKCIACGGDDILYKPVNRSILKTKILAFERIRGIYGELATLHEQSCQDQLLAQQVFAKAIRSNEVALEGIEVRVRGAAIFSGDVVFAEQCPNGDTHLLMADFTGHGLQAAISAMPVADIFSAMSRQGYRAEDILAQINTRLYELLPTWMFMACNMVVISPYHGRWSICNAGMPDIRLIAPSGVSCFRSKMPPLGISPTISPQFDYAYAEANSSLLLISDGVIEANNAQGDFFGSARLDNVIELANIHNVASVLDAQLQTFCADAELHDDISIVAIPASSILASPLSRQQGGVLLPSGPWECQFSLIGASLGQSSLVPMVMSWLQQLDVPEEISNLLFTVISELYNNALEHGILQLDSSMKNSAEGFSRYYELRQARLSQNPKAKITLRLDYREKPKPSFLIEVEHNGLGFELGKFNFMGRLNKQALSLSGRGLNLVKQLCEQLSYHKQGRCARALFALDRHYLD